MGDFLTAPSISLWQPHAILWLIPEAKVNETRHWPFPEKYRGKRILVHAAKKRVPLDDYDDELIEVCRTFIGSDWQSSMAYGAFIGSTTLASCRSMGDLVEPAVPAHANDEICGYWAPHRYAWRGENPRIFSTPVPAVGHQGFWLAGVPRSLIERAEPAGPPSRPLGLYAPHDTGEAAEPPVAPSIADEDGDAAVPGFLKRLVGVS